MAEYVPIISKEQRDEHKDSLLKPSAKPVMEKIWLVADIVSGALAKTGLWEIFGGFVEEWANDMLYRKLFGPESKQWLRALVLDLSVLKWLQKKQEKVIKEAKEEEGVLAQGALQNILDKYPNNIHATTILTEARNQWIKNVDQLSYIVATTKHETAIFKHLKEIEPKKKEKDYWKPAKNGKVYCGRWYVHLTREKNYKKMQKEIKKDERFDDIDIVKNPEILETNKELAAFVMVKGMKMGTFTGKSLDDYTGNGTFDAVGAREVVNGSDKAQKIADIYSQEKETMMT